MHVYPTLLAQKEAGKKSFAVLIDPDKVSFPALEKLVEQSNAAGVDYFLVGGSLVLTEQLDEQIQFIKSHSSIPVVLFPGSPSQVCKYADSLLYLSLISGRNAELLIGQHVTRNAAQRHRFFCRHDVLTENTPISVRLKQACQVLAKRPLPLGRVGLGSGRIHIVCRGVLSRDIGSG